MLSLLAFCSSIDNREFSLGVFIDITKAFDAVNHFSIRRNFWCSCGCPQLILQLSQQVYCNGSLSSPRIITFVVPQGSFWVLSSSYVFFNDLPNAYKLLKFMLFANDPNIFVSNHSHDALSQLMNNELSHVNDWLALDNWSLNLKKSITYYVAQIKPISSTNSTLHIV